jgi:hypothetical protein
MHTGTTRRGERASWAAILPSPIRASRSDEPTTGMSCCGLGYRRQEGDESLDSVPGVQSGLHSTNDVSAIDGRPAGRRAPVAARDRLPCLRRGSEMALRIEGRRDAHSAPGWGGWYSRFASSRFSSLTADSYHPS